MTTLQPPGLILPNSLEPNPVTETLKMTQENCYLASDGPAGTDTAEIVVDLPVSLCTVPLSSSSVSDKPAMSRSETFPVTCIVPASCTGQAGNTVITTAEIHTQPADKQETLLSATASEFSPSVAYPLQDSRPYPPGYAKDGVEWSVSDTAWMALEYGREDALSFEPDNRAKPDLENTRNLKTIEVKLSNGGIFEDKLLPPLSKQVVPHPKFSKEYFLDLHNKVREYGTYNYAGAKVKLQHSNLNIELFRYHLQGYDDLEILSYLEYGFPIGLTQVFFLEPLTKNHSSAYEYFSFVDSFIAKGISLAECTGPWPEAPIDPVMVSPLMTADKPPDSRRSVFDASYGDFSLNQNTPEKEYLGEDYSFTFPSVLDLADLVVEQGEGCLLYKRDLSRWFLQLPVDPGDYDKLSFVWRGNFWLFCCYVWGTRHAGYNGQRVASAILYILRKLGVELTQEQFNALVYMDDFAGCERGARAQLAFDTLGKLLSDLGVRESIDKASPPSTTMRFLGVEFDTIKMCMRVDEVKRAEIQKLSVFWSRKTVATKQELQSILGKLIWISKVVRYSRCFVSRIISALKTLKHQKQKATLTEAVKKDFKWWAKFLNVFNGVELLVPTTVFASVLGDACPMGGGSWNEQAKEYFSRRFPHALCDTIYPIHLKEFWCVIIAARLWGHLWSGKRVAIYCDNEAVVKTVTNQKPTDKELQNCLREFFFHVCAFKFQPVLIRISSCDNSVADFISRNHDPEAIGKMFLSKDIMEMKEVKVDDKMFEFIGDW